MSYLVKSHSVVVVTFDKISYFLKRFATRICIANLIEIHDVSAGTVIKMANGILIYSISKLFSVNEEYIFKIPFIDNYYSIVGNHNISDGYGYNISFTRYNNKFKIWHSNSNILTVGVIAIGRWK